jgi:hypothetical protein
MALEMWDWTDSGTGWGCQGKEWYGVAGTARNDGEGFTLSYLRISTNSNNYRFTEFSIAG